MLWVLMTSSSVWRWPCMRSASTATTPSVGSGCCGMTAALAWLQFTAGHRGSTINLGALLFAHTIRRPLPLKLQSVLPCFTQMLQPW